MHFAVNLLDAKSLISSWGLAGLLLIIFAETGLLIGFFLPGDTLLFLAGASTVAGAQYHLSLGALLVGSAVASIVGAVEIPSIKFAWMKTSESSAAA